MRSLSRRFAGCRKPKPRPALRLAVDLGLLTCNKLEFEPSNPLVRFIGTPDENRKAALLRIVLESYRPFVVFRDRLLATNSADVAAQQTKTLLDVDAHREEIKDTLISLGTYSSAPSVKVADAMLRRLAISSIPSRLSQVRRRMKRLRSESYGGRSETGPIPLTAKR